MSDPMTRLTQTTLDLKKFTSIFNYWAILEIVILLCLAFANIIFPLVFLEPWLTLVTGIIAFFLVLTFLVYLFIKDTQLRILLTLIRAILGAFLPLALLFTTNGPLALWLWILTAILVLVGLLLLYFVLKPVLTMRQLTKEILKAAVSG